MTIDLIAILAGVQIAAQFVNAVGLLVVIVYSHKKAIIPLRWRLIHLRILVAFDVAFWGMFLRRLTAVYADDYEWVTVADRFVLPNLITLSFFVGMTMAVIRFIQVLVEGK